ncbi:MAG: MlaD family protein [Spirochaetia bacterium]|nr:MlaD family protein [Spirochaetia bacterium]
MTQSKDRYYKIGLFVTLGFALLIGGMLILGAGSFFRPTIHMETYFDESVQGLDIGSAVKHRGVQIGTVESIGFVRNEYKDLSEEDYYRYGKYVLVQIALTNPLGMKGKEVYIFRLHQVRLLASLRTSKSFSAGWMKPT